MIQISNKKGMTLIELIMAMLLFSVVILTGISMEIGMRRIFSSADVQAQLLSEVSPIAAMITKDINRGIGDSFSGSPYINASTPSEVNYSIRVDSNGNGKVDTTDIWVRYFLRTQGNQKYKLIYFNNTSDLNDNETLSIRVTFFEIKPPINGISNFNIQLFQDSDNLVVNVTNPEVTINSSAQYRMWSLS